jgi:hypothetical protein
MTLWTDFSETTSLIAGGISLTTVGLSSWPTLEFSRHYALPQTTPFETRRISFNQALQRGACGMIGAFLTTQWDLFPRQLKDRSSETQ